MYVNELTSMDEERLALTVVLFLIIQYMFSNSSLGL